MALTELPDDLPRPQDDGAANHLNGMRLPAIALPATDGSFVDTADLSGITVVYAYPMTGRPDTPLPDGWDEIPGARGCTPQACAFRDHMDELKNAGADQVFGISTQNSEYQREAARRLHLPFLLLSDHRQILQQAMRLPTMEVEGNTLLKRLTWIARDGVIVKVFYPVFPPDRNAGDVLAWLQANIRP